MPYTWRAPWRLEEDYSWQTLDELADAWWGEELDEDLWPKPAHDFQWQRFKTASDDCVEILDALIHRAPDNYDLGLLGAGEVEDLLSHFGHGARFVDEVETRCRQDSNWRKAVAGVWLSDDVTSDVRGRLAIFGATDLTGEHERADRIEG